MSRRGCLAGKLISDSEHAHGAHLETLTCAAEEVTMLIRQREGPSTIYLASEKPIVRSPPPHRFNRELLARTYERTNNGGKPGNHQGLRDTLASRYRWSTTTGEAAAEGALPTPRYPVPLTTLEPHADPVQREKYLALQRREPSIWQQFAREWDMIQARRPMEPRTKPGFSLYDLWYLRFQIDLELLLSLQTKDSIKQFNDNV